MLYNIIGWYGTETMGDIAILDGIIDVIKTLDKESKFTVGSLYPFYTERTLYMNFPQKGITLYNEKSRTERLEVLKKSDVVLIGGGPLMDIGETTILLDIFKEAKKRGIPRLVFGCGIGPISEYAQCVKEIIETASAVSFRDNFAKLVCDKNSIPTDGCYYIGDPAVVSVENFMQKKRTVTQNGDIAFNLRKFPLSEYGDEWGLTQEQVRNLIEELAKKYDVCLIPMHTFCIGNDDRDFFSELMYNRKSNVSIQYSPKSLYELYDAYRSAFACIGMRYHAVLMQSILNGNNIILDYTDSKYGKIQGFLDKIDKGHFYKERCINIRKPVSDEKLYETITILERRECFNYKITGITYDTKNSCQSMMSSMKKQYVNFVKNALV